MPDLLHYIRVGFLIAAVVIAAIIAIAVVLAAPGLIVGQMYGEGWGLIVGLPWAFACIIAASVVITAATEGDIEWSEPDE